MLNFRTDDTKSLNTRQLPRKAVNALKNRLNFITNEMLEQKRKICVNGGSINDNEIKKKEVDLFFRIFFVSNLTFFFLK